MTFLDVVSILVFSFGALAFSAFAVLWVQELRAKTRALSFAEGLFAFYAAAWFLVNIALVFGPTYPEGARLAVELIRGEMTFLWPPVMMHSVYAACPPRRVSSKLWRYLLVSAYAVALGVATLSTLSAFRQGGPWSSPWIDGALITLFLAAGLYSGALMYRPPSASGQRRTRDPALLRTYRNWAWVLLALLVIILAVDIWIVRSNTANDALSLAARSFPLLFLFINTYYLERFTFFDVFVKRGTFSILVLVLLTVYSFFAVGVIHRVGLGGFAPWALALSLLPLALNLPWIYRKLEAWLDRAWWGRRFGAVEAVKYFLACIQPSTTEAQLVRRAQQTLSSIFRADARILLADEVAPPDFDSMLDVPIQASGSSIGSLHLGPRHEAMPYFSKDVTLVTTLADVFAYMMENIRLQQKKQAQETRERELTIHASRSELKALRAQINPHFLFNALNAIAGLVHKNPHRAEEAVEQLSEVFRYTLRGSEKEWARLEDELEFVRTYLEVERARFGDRLRVSIDLDEKVGNPEIPTMIVQTLVENAVKHGVARVRGVGSISVIVRQKENLIHIRVEDNGPGLSPHNKGSSEYGLKNIRDRLLGYYGDQAKLEVTRDNASGRTIASVERPPASERSRATAGTS